MNISLTGATGFIGSYILSQLIKCGHNVTIIKRFNSDTKRIDDFLNVRSVIENYKNMTSSVVFERIIHAATSYEKATMWGGKAIW